MKKGDGEMKVWGLIVILMLVTSAFSGAVSAENVSEDLTKSVADAEIQTVVDNLNSAELAESTALDALNVVTDATVNIDFSNFYIHQCGDTSNDFDGRCACGATSSVMIAAYHGRLPQDRIWCTSCAPAHWSNYGKYVSKEYTCYSYTFDRVYQTQTGTGKGAYGHIHDDLPERRYWMCVGLQGRRLFSKTWTLRRIRFLS